MGHRGAPRRDRRDGGRTGSPSLIGHSFGGRLAFELAARAPKLVPRLVLLDPAILLPGHVALAAAENARRDKTYVSFDELIDRRYDESQLHSTPRELVVEDLAQHVEIGDDGLVPVPLLPVGGRRRLR